MVFDNTKPLLPNMHKQYFPGGTFWTRFTGPTVLHLPTSSCRGWGRGTALGKGEGARRVTQAAQARRSQSHWGSGAEGSAAGEAAAPNQSHGENEEKGGISREEHEVAGDVQIWRGEPQTAGWLHGGLSRRGRGRSAGTLRPDGGATPPAAPPGIGRRADVPPALQASAAQSTCRRVLTSPPTPLFLRRTFPTVGWERGSLPATHASPPTSLVFPAWSGGAGGVFGPGCLGRPHFVRWFLDVLYSAGNSSRLPSLTLAQTFWKRINTCVCLWFFP